MIGELQGDFGDLDNKYLKQNIPKYLNMSVITTEKCYFVDLIIRVLSTFE